MRQRGFGTRLQHWDAEELVPVQRVFRGQSVLGDLYFWYPWLTTLWGKGLVQIAAFCRRPLTSSGQQSGSEKAWKVVLTPLSCRADGATPARDAGVQIGAPPFPFHPGPEALAEARALLRRRLHRHTIYIPVFPPHVHLN